MPAMPRRLRPDLRKRDRHLHPGHRHPERCRGRQSRRSHRCHGKDRRCPLWAVPVMQQLINWPSNWMKVFPIICSARSMSGASKIRTATRKPTSASRSFPISKAIRNTSRPRPRSWHLPSRCRWIWKKRKICWSGLAMRSLTAVSWT